MSRDFSPREHWLMHMQFPDLHFGNIIVHYAGKEQPIYTEEELETHKRYPHIWVTGSDIFNSLKSVLSEDEFQKLDKTLEELAKADINHKSTSDFPKHITDWYFNRSNHYYHEPNDEEFMESIQNQHHP